MTTTRNKIAWMAVLVLVVGGLLALRAAGVGQPLHSTATTLKFECQNAGVISTDYVQRCIGYLETVDFVPGNTYTDSAGTEFLDSTVSPYFTVVIEPSDLSSFNFDPATTNGEEIQVDGRITEYNGHPQILNPDDITIEPPPTPPYTP